MYGKGLGINAFGLEQVQNHLQGKLTFEITNLLENLTDSNLVPKAALSAKPGGYTLSNAVSVTKFKVFVKLTKYFFILKWLIGIEIKMYFLL